MPSAPEFFVFGRALQILTRKDSVIRSYALAIEESRINLAVPVRTAQVCALCDSKQHPERTDISAETSRFRRPRGENFCMRTAQPQETESTVFRSAIQKNSRRRSAVRLFGYGLLAIIFAAGGASGQSVTATVAAGAQPQSAAINAVTNKIYVANFKGNSVTVIDGATNTPITVAAGSGPGEVAVNPVTNKVYVANVNGNSVTVIDGVTNTTTTVAVGANPGGIAVNPVTNKIYVANGHNVTIINGATNATTMIAAGTNAGAIAVNPVTNKIYVVNGGSNNVTVIDGATNTTATVGAGSGPVSVGVNPVTNKIYVVNNNSASVTVIDGSSNNTATVAVGAFPQGLVVNPVTNKIYVANAGGSGNVTVINGATNTTATVTVDWNPLGMAVNPVTNQIYMASATSNIVSVMDGATNTATTKVAVGVGPFGVAVNPVTNKIYVANSVTNNVTVIDGATNTTATVVGAGIGAVVNLVTNKIYVANYFSGTVSVIDGASDTVIATVAAGGGVPTAVNPVTNKIYLVNGVSKNVTVIDGASDTVTATIAIAGGMGPLAVNPVTNKIYMTSFAGNSVSVIDGASDTVIATVASGGAGPLAVNPVTNKIYVSNVGTTHVTVIDGATNTASTIELTENSHADAIAVNPLTNKVYVSSVDYVTVINGATNTIIARILLGDGPMHLAVDQIGNKIYQISSGSSALTVIDGTTDKVFTRATGIVSYGPPVGFNCVGLVVNPVTNKIYVANSQIAQSVTVIDGTSFTSTVVAFSNSAGVMAVNPVTNKVYVAVGNDEAVLTEQKVQPIPLLTKITSLTGNQTTSHTPSFNFQTSSTYAPITPTPIAVYFQVDTWQGTWTRAGGSNPAFTGQTGTLSLGTHVLFAYASDGQDASINGDAFNGQVTIGQIAAYPFAVMEASTATALNADVNPSVVGGTVNLTATATVIEPGTGTPTGTVTFLDGTTKLGTETLNGSGVATFTTSTLTAGSHSITAAYGGDSNFTPSTSAILSQVVLAPSFTVSGSPSSVTVSAGNPASYQILVTGMNNFSSAVTLSCTAGLPRDAGCAFSATSVTPGPSPAASTLTISTMARTTALVLPFSGGPESPQFTGWLLLSAITLGLLGLAVPRPRGRLRLGYALALPLVGCVLWQAGCGTVSSNGGGTTTGTPAGTYAITVTGTSGTTQQTASVTLVVK
jgi:YVTN family beta-propeller protein